MAITALVAAGGTRLRVDGLQHAPPGAHDALYQGFRTESGLLTPKLSSLSGRAASYIENLRENCELYLI